MAAVAAPPAPIPAAKPAALAASLPAAEPAAVASPPGVDPAAIGIVNGHAAEPPATPTKTVAPASVDQTPSVVSPDDLKASNIFTSGAKESALTIKSLGSEKTTVAGGPYLNPISQWGYGHIGDALAGFLHFGFGLKDVFEDIYKRVKKYEDDIPEPGRLRLEVEVQKYNRACRVYNGACESITERLKAPKKVVWDEMRNSYVAKNIDFMMWTIAEIDDMKTNTEAKYKLLLKELGCHQIPVPGETRTANMTHSNENRLRRQVRKALGLAPFPLSVA